MSRFWAAWGTGHPLALSPSLPRSPSRRSAYTYIQISDCIHIHAHIRLHTHTYTYPHISHTCAILIDIVQELGASLSVYGFGGCRPCNKYFDCDGSNATDISRPDIVRAEASGADSYHPFAREAEVRCCVHLYCLSPGSPQLPLLLPHRSASPPVCLTGAPELGSRWPPVPP